MMKCLFGQVFTQARPAGRGGAHTTTGGREFDQHQVRRALAWHWHVAGGTSSSSGDHLSGSLRE
eukprot:3304163-Prymnesium_polylepis.2